MIWGYDDPYRLSLQMGLFVGRAGAEWHHGLRIGLLRAVYYIKSEFR